MDNLSPLVEKVLLKDMGATVTGVGFSPAGHVVASVSANNIVRLWNVESGRDLGQLAGRDAVFDPNGRILALINVDHAARLWDLEKGQELRRLEGPAVDKVIFSPDGRLLVGIVRGALQDRAVLWNVAGGRDLRRLKIRADNVRSVAFSPDGRILASGGSELRLWEVESGAELRRFQGHTAEVHSVAFSPDGNLLASGSWDQTVRLWEVDSGRDVRQLRGHQGYVNSVAFSPEGQMLASGGWDHTVRLWNLDLPDTHWQRLERQWQAQLGPAWRAAGRCEVCGQKVSFWNRWRAVKRCSRHR